MEFARDLGDWPCRGRANHRESRSAREAIAELTGEATHGGFPVGDNPTIIPFDCSGTDNKTLRSIAYTSFDQPWAIQHFASRPLEHDLTGEFSGTTTIHYGFGTGLSRLVELRRKGNLQERTVFLGAVTTIPARTALRSM